MADPAKTENPEIMPQVMHLVDLLKWAREGRLRVPRFQREFVWRRQDILDLFDSIANQYPIGTLFLWGPETMPASRDHIGPLALPEAKGQTWLVLDGQQRLTALVGVLLAGNESWGQTVGDDDELDLWEVYFDASDEGGFVYRPKEEESPSSWFPVPALLDTMSFFGQVKKIMESTPPEEASAWVNRAQEVAQAIQSYRVPIVMFTTNDLNTAVESFSRLNRKGRTIGEDEMFSALTYTEGDENAFHLAKKIDHLQLEMKRSNFGEVGRTILLRAVLTAADLDMYRTDWTRLSGQVKSATREKLPQAVEEAEVGLERAREFLREIGIQNARMLPYSMQLVALCAFFGRCSQPTGAQKKLLERWFWVSSFSGWFGSGNPSRVRRLVQELHSDLVTRAAPDRLENMRLDEEAQPTPSRFDLRSARVRTLVCLLLRQPPRWPDGSEMTLEAAASLLLLRGPEAMSVICATVRDPDLRTSPANRILDVAPNVRGQAKNWLLKIEPSVRDQVLESHAIPPESFEFLRQGKHEEFLGRRMEFLGQLERSFMEEAGVTPPADSGAAPSPIDTDDEMTQLPLGPDGAE